MFGTLYCFIPAYNFILVIKSSFFGCYAYTHSRQPVDLALSLQISDIKAGVINLSCIIPRVMLVALRFNQEAQIILKRFDS